MKVSPKKNYFEVEITNYRFSMYLISLVYTYHVSVWFGSVCNSIMCACAHVVCIMCCMSVYIMNFYNNNKTLAVNMS